MQGNVRQSKTKQDKTNQSNVFIVGLKTKHTKLIMDLHTETEFDQYLSVMK